MATGSPFVPTPFTTSVVAPRVSTQYRRVAYCSPSEFRFAPTAVGTNALVNGSGNQPADSLASLVQVIYRASSWADRICHRPDGSLAAQLVTESDWVKPKSGGELCLTCNLKPVAEVVGLGLGSTPSTIGNVDANTAGNIWIDGTTIWVPGNWSVPSSSNFPRPITYNTSLFAVWQYVAGFASSTLTANVTLGANAITVAPSTPGGTTVQGVYAGTQLVIHDGAQTETVVAASSPTGLTITLENPTAFAHTVPASPDFTRVSALPDVASQAVILLTSCLLKVKGSRATQMAHAPNTPPKRPMLAEVGAEQDFDLACKMLQPFTMVMVHG